MYWGIDSGSTSVNVLLLNDEKDILGYRIAESGLPGRQKQRNN